MGKVDNSFRDHIARIKFAKRRTSEVLAGFDTPTKVAMASLSHTWEQLFDSICRNSDDGSMGKLKDISSVIQKLSSSHKRIQEIGFRHIEKMKAENLDDELQKLQAMRRNLQNKRLPHEILTAVEEQLQLL
jgi:hypothetical protein